MTDLVVWTIYERPADFPHGFVVRPWSVTTGNVVGLGAVQYALTLAEARALIPAGLVLFPRQDDDDGVIVESWL